ncbi:GAF domain-containing protein [Nocardioides sp.]|uniref:hybrid sensor histidine kinase/response regulator n=1 Tax=Nocardioides sp. TaxID=35761 RepID=UPI002623B8E8|nr:GAF domain-containing protein [Nocardioides sp.]MCW2736691.1 His Kinase (phosphoacceptor) domain protein [Nocardioides sp.]
MVEPAPDLAVGTVSAAEHERLRRDHDALRDRFEATAEVLEAMGRSTADPDAVLTTIVENARRLCGSEAAHLYLLEDGTFRLMRTVGLSEESRRLLTEHPIAMDRETLTGRVGLERRTLQIADVLIDPDYGRHDLQRAAGFRTVVAAPLIVDDEVVGALNVWRNDVRPFGDREMAIVSAFAVQAAIAVHGVRLVQQLESRGVQLARKVDELEALRAVGEAVSSTLDLEDVLDTIAEHAVALSDTDGGSIMEYAEHERRFFVRSAYRTAPEVVEQLRSVRIDLDATLVGRAARERRPIVVPDLTAAVELDPHLEILRSNGWLSLVAVPLLREGKILGSLIVRRKRTGDFPAEVVDLLETFASQSALALLNAQLFRELKEQSLELEMASRHKSEFLASMSHELRTPLNAVLGFSEVLLERMFGDINERQEEYLRDIHGSGKHLLELLNEILDLSKVEAGRMELEYSAVDLGLLLGEAVGMLRERASSHGISLRVDIDPAVGVVYSDQLRIKQVVLNLVTNAVKFTGDGGTVLVRARRTPTDIEVTVTDTGIGIPEPDRERIFESFQQGGRGASREEGTGLGLTLSRRLVELLGGRMWLTSEVGVGSTFGFALPSRTSDDVPDPDQAPGSREVVVIEDDRPSLDLFSAFLDGASVRVTAARDGLAGLEAVRRKRPSAVLLDIRLPGMDGWAVLTALKAQPETRDIPVIVVSIVDERQRGAALGAAAYLVKPVSRDALLDALERVVPPVRSGAGALEPE